MKNKTYIPHGASAADRDCGRLVTGALATGLILAICFVSACSHSDQGNGGSPSASPAGSTASGVDAGAIVEKYRALDNSRDSEVKLKASIQDSSGPARVIQLTVLTKKQADGGKMLLVEFTSPPEERDRDALIVVSAGGSIEATRYTESSDSFLTTKSATDEESLFGLTLQELVGGQPENYTYKVLGEETYQGTPVYRIEGTLKPGIESRFPRTVMLVSKDNYAGLVIEPYDNHNELGRRITLTRNEKVDGIWTRTQWSVDNIEDKKKIDFSAIEVKYNQNLSDTLFTRDHLKKIAARAEM
ncbi:MAG TPA: outer membrane lipoprotein-sorting protein [Blastocatellia bacterium]|nr:outer membrane lipoprotein-sorting protein [Blastocatellia bacterium]